MLGLRKYRGRVSFLPLDADRSRMKQYSTVTSDENRLDTGKSSRTAECPETSGDLPPLSSSVPPDWVTIEDDFVMFLAVFLSHIAQDLIVAPTSRPDDGIIHLSMVRAPVSRVRLLKLFDAMEDGTASDDPAVETVRVSAFRLEPLGQRQGALTVDGELVDYGPIQARVLPSLARVMSLDNS